MDSSLYETAKKLFSEIDTEKKGYILREDLTLLSDGFTDSQLHCVFSELDKDGEGKIALDDFASAFIALSQGRYDENSEQSADEELSLSNTDPERHDCFSSHVSPTHCDENKSINDCGNTLEPVAHSGIGSQACTLETEPEQTVHHFRDYQETVSDQMLSEDCNDDIFEGEGLHANTPTLGTSPSRPAFVRSPSIHRRKRTVSSDQSGADSKIPDTTQRSPPDGNEETHCQRRRSLGTRKNGSANKRKSTRTHVCLPGSGFAKDAILDVLKIVDSHTIANLGLYDNSKSAWRRNVNMNSLDIIGKDSKDNISTWCPSFVDQDYENPNNEAHDRSRGCVHCQSDHLYTELRLNENEACGDFERSRANSQNVCLHSDAASNCTSEDGATDSRTGVFSPCSGSSDHAYSFENHSELDLVTRVENRDSNENIYNSDDGGETKGTREDSSSPYISATVGKEDIGNLIYENDCERRACLYDRILSVSGVELNSRLSSSQSSLHDLILEAEVAKKSAAIVEEWDSVLKRINGVSLFGGNATVRSLWQQLSLHHTDLLQPFEDFLKSVIAEVNRAYSKCNEVKQSLQSKVEQLENKVECAYQDTEQLLSREKEQAQKNQADREEHLRMEFNRIIGMKDADLIESLRSKSEVELRLEKKHQECHLLRNSKEKLEKEISDLITVEVQLRSENDQLIQENSLLNERLTIYAQNANEMQEQLIKQSRVTDTYHEDYRRCYRMYQDTLEEKEYCEMNISNLTQELEDLKNVHKTLQDRVDNTGVLWRDGQASPRRERSADLYEKRDSRTLRFPNGIMPVSQSKRNSLVSEPSYDEPVTEIPLTNVAKLAVPDVVPVKTRAVKSPPKDASTPLKGSNLNKKTEESVSKKIQQAVPPTVVHHTGQEYKVIFVGDAAVGKTSLIRKISRGTFSSQRESTTSPDFVKKTVTVENQSVTLNIWDTVGQERCSYVLKVEGFAHQLTFRFNSLPPSYFRKADAVVLVYNIIEKVSFLNVRSWIKTIYQYADDNFLLVLCGNKSDLDHRRQVREEKALKIAKNNDAIYLESSAKTGHNVAQLCEVIASTLLERDETVFIRETSVTTLHQDLLGMQRSTMKSCC